MEGKEIKLEELSKEQLDSLIKKAEAVKTEAERRRREDKEAYLQMVDEAIMESIPELKEISEKMLQAKAKVFERFEKLIEIKESLYKVKDNQQTHTFTTQDGKLTLCLGSRTVNDYDSTLDSGIEKIKKYISSFDADNELTEVVNHLLKLDKNGNLKPSRVMELAQLANKIDNIDFKEGVAIIQQAYQPRATCQFVTACENKETGKEYIPLSMSRI